MSSNNRGSVPEPLQTACIHQFVFLALVALSILSTSACGVTKAVASGQNVQANNAASQLIKIAGALPGAEVGTSYNATIQTIGGKAPYHFSVSWGKLPAGLSLGANNGTISGIPTNQGTFNFGIHVTDSNRSGSAAALEIIVSPSKPITVLVSPANITIASNGNEQFTAIVSNTSDLAVTWSASIGSISSAGLYEAPSVTASRVATITATSNADASKSGKAFATITVPPLTISTTSLSGAVAQASYSERLTATGGVPPYTWGLGSGNLPRGISVQTDGLLGGIPVQSGQFSFTVTVSDSSSPQQTATQPLLLNVGISPFFFGADFNNGATWPPTDGQSLTASLGGIRLWDDGVKWGQINTANGEYNWSKLDTWLDRAQSQGMDVLYTFGDTPQFTTAATAPAGCLSPGPYSCAPPIDVNPDGTGTDTYFQTFVTALVTHAAGRIAYYELWNEPDCKCFWSGTTAQLVRMGKDAAAIIRSLDPNAKILSPSAHGPTMATWFDGYISEGGAANFDIVNVHMRGAGAANASPEAFLDVYSQVQSELQKRSLTNLPLWDDEHGILVGQLTDPDMLAGYTARSVALRAGVGLQRQYVYTWDTPSSTYGLQGNESGTAWDQVASWLSAHAIDPCAVNGTVYTCTLDSGQIVWDSAQSCSDGICTTSTYVYHAGYAWYRDLSGNRLALNGTTVQIGYKPIFLETQ